MEIQDIEQIKQINALAKELLEHGIASNMEEAADQARKMIEKGQTIEVKRDSEITVRPASPQSLSNPGHSLLGFDDLKQRIETVEQQMESMIGKINEIISELNRVQKGKTEAPAPRQENSPITMEAPKNDQQAHLKDEKVEPHHRTGKYVPGDVAIEKMFYFGGGRR